MMTERTRGWISVNTDSQPTYIHTLEETTSAVCLADVRPSRFGQRREVAKSCVYVV